MYDLDNEVSFVFDGRNHAKMAGILRRRFGEPDFISDPGKPATSWLRWDLTPDDTANMDEHARTAGPKLHLQHVVDLSLLVLSQRDLIRVRDFERRQLDDF